ncbi:MAG: DUF6602 domain-containing protein [Planctomycetaceae bacterium]
MRNVFGETLRYLDSALEIESQRAGLHQHNATAGSVRELLVKGLLQQFLPASVFVETGKVIDFAGGMSKQIDIILFDARVPYLRSPGGVGLFPVEGVLGAIAVKTRISSSDELVDTLENCGSVIERMATGDADFLAAVDRKIEEQVRREKLTRLEAYIQVMHLAFPPTYVFAIHDGLSAAGMCDSLDAWFHRPKDFVEVVPAIPRMIIAGHCVSVAHDGINKLAVSPSVAMAASDEYGAAGRVLAGIWPQVQHRWSWLATHILMSVSYRLGITHDFLQARYRIDRYLPIEECFEIERQQEAEVYHVLWNGRFPAFQDSR